MSVHLSKGVLGSVNAKLSYELSFTDNELFFNNQFIESENRNHKIDVGLSWDNGSWYSLDYKANFNYGTSAVQNNKINSTFIFHTANLDFYTSASTRLHFGVESAQAATSSSGNSRNTMSNMSFFYKPSKKLFLKAAVTNIFDTSTFTTTFSSGNGINLTQFELRPRQFTIGLTYSL